MVCPDQQQAFANISLSRQTAVDRVTDLAGDLNERVNSFNCHRTVS